MTEKATQQTPFSQAHDEDFFKEIENRAYKGARRAIAHFVFMAVITSLIIWAVLAFAVYTFVVPYVSNMMEQQLDRINPVNQLQQEGIIDQFKKLYPG